MRDRAPDVEAAFAAALDPADLSGLTETQRRAGAVAANQRERRAEARLVEAATETGMWAAALMAYDHWTVRAVARLLGLKPSTTDRRARAFAGLMTQGGRKQ